jgi:Tfp pilus assembly protein PilX
MLDNTTLALLALAAMQTVQTVMTHRRVTRVDRKVDNSLRPPALERAIEDAAHAILDKYVKDARDDGDSEDTPTKATPAARRRP